MIYLLKKIVMIGRIILWLTLFIGSVFAQPLDRLTDTNKDDSAVIRNSQKLSGKKIIKKFLASKKDNYPYSPLVHGAILTEKETLKEGAQIYSSKAWVEYMRRGYLDFNADQIQLINGTSYVFNDTLFRDNMFGGLSQIKKDIIKYPSGFFDLRCIDYYFKACEIEEDKKLFYRVEVVPITPKAKYKGYLIIEPSSFALVKAEFSLTNYGIMLLNRLQAGSSFEWLGLTETIVYKKPYQVKQYLADDDRYYLSSIVTKGHGVHLDWKKESEVINSLKVIDTNRTTFFANEYGRIDDYFALSSIDHYKP